MNDTSSRIKENLYQIQKKIETAARKSGRQSSDIHLVAVTKTISSETIEEVIKENIFDFAENKVQELLKKYDILTKQSKWHYIGRLQTNKVKYIIDFVELIHSVDRMPLVHEINKRAENIGKYANILVQVNISREQSKTGVYPEDLVSFLNEASECSNVRIRGLMTMAPNYQNPEDARWIFTELRKLSIDIKMIKNDNITMDFLSMGMSSDYEIAIEEGSNLVRIGSSLFK